MPSSSVSQANAWNTIDDTEEYTRKVKRRSAVWCLRRIFSTTAASPNAPLFLRTAIRYVIVKNPTTTTGPNVLTRSQPWKSMPDHKHPAASTEPRSKLTTSTALRKSWYTPG